MSDQQGPENPSPQSPEPEEASPPADTSEAPAQTAPSAAAVPPPAPPPGSFWDRPSRRTLFIVMAVFGVWAIVATAFAFAGHDGRGFRFNHGSMNSRRYGGMMGDADHYGNGYGAGNSGGMMNGNGYSAGNGGGMMNGGGMIVCPNGANPSNVAIPPSAPSSSPIQGTTQYGPGMACRVFVPGNWSGWTQSSSGSSSSQATTQG